MSINLVSATRIANNRLDVLKNEIGVDIKIIENATIEKDLYWVFFYDSKLYLEDGDLSAQLAGNSPLIIDKIHGNIYETGTSNSVEFYMEEFENIKLPSLK